MGLIPNLCHEQQGRMVAAQGQLSAIHIEQTLKSHLATLALDHTDQDTRVVTAFLKDLGSHAELPLAAIDEHEVGKALGFTIAAQQRLSHGGIVVSRCDALNVESTVLARLHGMVVVDDARGLGGLASGVTDVETLDAQQGKVVLRSKPQRVGQQPRLGLRTTLLLGTPGQSKACVVLGHAQPIPSLALRRMKQLGRALCARPPLEKRLHRPLPIQDQGGNAGRVAVVLPHKGHQGLIEHGLLVLIEGRCIHREVGTVSQMTTTPHHGQIDHQSMAIGGHRENVAVLAVLGLHGVLLQHAREGRDLISKDRRLFKGEPLRGLDHVGLQALQDLLMAALEKGQRALGVSGVVLRGDDTDARCATPMNLVEQAGPRTIGKHGVCTAAELEDLLQNLDALLHGPAVWKRAKVIGLPIHCPPVETDSGKGMTTHSQVRIRLVVSEKNVVSRRLRFDQVALEQQGLCLRPNHGDLSPMDLRDHLGDSRAVAMLLKV